MGIRFFCPNGHRLNVKSFLAGKRGVCPDCGIGVNIPMESDARASSKQKSLGSDDAASENDSAASVLERSNPASAQEDIALPVSPSLPPAATATTPVPVTTPSYAFETVRPAPVAPTTAAPVLSAAVSVAPVTPAVAVVSVMPSPVAAPVTVPNVASLPAVTALSGASVATPFVVPAAPATQINDSIAEAPMAIWYVRPPAGGQYGPARGDVMRKWLAEGRVTADSIVWREGWPDWRPATKVFPQLASPASAEAMSLIGETPRRPIRPARKTSRAAGVAIVIALGLVCVGLFVALIYVLINSEPPPTP